MIYLALFSLLLIAAWAISTFLLSGEDLSEYDRAADSDAVVTFPGHEGPSDGHWEAVAAVEEFGSRITGMSRTRTRELMREYMDEQGRIRQFASEITRVDAGGVPAEWVCAEGANPARRVLYIHGGAFIAGSPLSHRNITNRFSEITGAAVLSIDYRLMPEHRRMDGIEDCRTAYRWILENGPGGPQTVDHLVVSGDSAGANLSLSLVNWVKEQGMRLPDAVVVLSAPVDCTFTSPSIVTNVNSDVMLGPLFRILLRVPAWIRRWLFVLENRMNPANPLVSPVFADLSGLPPTLLQVSEAEMLLDDSRRYANKARASGSPAVAQSWGHMMHVWHIFYPEVREAGEAWEEIRRFVESTRTKIS